MRFDARTAAVLRKASRGPAAIALRQNRLMFGNAGVGVGVSALSNGYTPATMRSSSPAPRVVQVSLGYVTRFKRVDGMAHNLRNLGYLGQASSASTIEAAGAGAAARYGATAGATSLASWAGAGAVAGPIGVVVGVVIGLLASKAFAKNYLNVANINVAEDDEVTAFNQYRTVAGRFAGRQVGVPAMRAVWLGAQHEGMFPLAANAPRQCFHNGCLKYGGRPDWVDSVLNHYGGPNDPAPNTFADVYPLWRAASAPPATAMPAVMVGRAMPAIGSARTSSRMLAGLGAVNPNLPAAVDFIDNYFIPANRAHSTPPWAVPSTALEHQILYDMADAWLATQPIMTAQFVALQPAPTPIGTPQLAPAAALPQPTAVVPSRTGAGGASSQVPGFMVFNPAGYNGQPTYVALADSGKVNQTIPIYAMVNGQMVQVDSMFNAAAQVQSPPMGAGGTMPVLYTGTGPALVPATPTTPAAPVTPAAPTGGAIVLPALLAAFAFMR
jgi:hypothetical protein